jgi:predicted nucleic acid-binding protein
MIVVSDTTPMNYLVLISAVDVLPHLFKEVIIPSSVLRELNHTKAPEVVRNWVKALPYWLQVSDPKSRLPSTALLDLGEADAISIAKERGIMDILIDEYQGRKIAESEGLFALPTIAVLERAAEQGLLDLGLAINALKRTTYRVRPEIIQAALERDAERKRKTGN